MRLSVLAVKQTRQMQQPRLTASTKKKPVTTLVGELWQLFVDYLKQETIVPVKDLGRFLVQGLAGSVLLSLGLVLLMLAGLRALQTETGSALDDDLSFVLLANDLPNDGVGRLLQEQVGAVLARYPQGPPTATLAP